MRDQAHDEIQQAFDSISNKTKTAIATVPELYLRRHDDGKYYIQAEAETADGSRLPGFLPLDLPQKNSDKLSKEMFTVVSMPKLVNTRRKDHQ